MKLFILLILAFLGVQYCKAAQHHYTHASPYSKNSDLGLNWAFGTPTIASSLGADFINNPEQVRYKYFKQTPLEIRGVKLGLCFALSAQNAGQISFDKAHMIEVTKDFEEIDQPQDMDLLTYLAGGEKRPANFASGEEENLKNWILSQPENSVTLLSVFEKSLELNVGNLWNTILTPHQFFRDAARWADKKRYHYTSSKEDQEKLFNHMTDIRGDLPERGLWHTADLYGSWYRFWGIMLYKMDNYESVTNVDKTKSIELQMGSAIADVVAIGDEVSKLISLSDNDKGKIDVDLAGVQAAIWLIEGVIHTELIQQNGVTSDLCKNPDFYLTSRYSHWTPHARTDGTRLPGGFDMRENE